jgi:hypothetical protein
LVAEVHFQIGYKWKVREVSLEADPSAGGGGAAGAEEEPFAVLPGHSGMGMNFTAGVFEGLGHAVIEAVAGNSESGAGQGLPQNLAVAIKPCHGLQRNGIFEAGLQAKSREGCRSDAAEKFAADAMAGIGAGFVEFDRETLLAQSEGAGQPGQSTAGEGDYFFHAKKRREPRSPVDSWICQAEPRPRAGASSPGRKPARMLTGISWRVTQPRKGWAKREKTRGRWWRRGSTKRR